MVSIGPYTQSTLLSYKAPNPQLATSSAVVPNLNTIYGLISNNPEFSIFLDLVKRARMEGELSYAATNLTVFIPSNSSMQAQIKAGKAKAFSMDTVEIDTAINIVKMHVINGRFGSDVIQKTGGADFKTRYGELHVATVNGVTTLNVDSSPLGYTPKSVNVLYFNIELGNGIVHVTDGLLLT